MHPFQAQFRFYAELNDFLPLDRKKRPFLYRFHGRPAIKDPIEAVGVPHTEVDLILVNGQSVGFGYYLKDGDCVSVYPVFESLNISPLVRLREKPLRRSAFVLDVHLGKLARKLRLLGFDVRYRNHCADPEIVAISARERRIVLTRDSRLLHAKAITHGYWLRSMDPEEQLREVLARFDLFSQIRPFHRCVVCNGKISSIEKGKIIDQLEPKTILYYEEFYRCEQCGKIYWKGSHYEKIK
ncbi:MAG: Mut7-C RNAse domain-containing protein, partial [Nitrospiria bacterium]